LFCYSVLVNESNSSGQIMEFLSLLLGGGAIGSLITAFFNRRKVGAEAEATISATILSYANTLRTDNNKLRDDFRSMQETVDKLQADLKDAAERFSQAQDRTDKLKEIAEALEARHVNDQVIIDRLFAAMKASDPNNPLILELQALASKAATVPNLPAA
jgi:septal ring factor EnvC (AmiA/AmiB activator)